MTDVTFQLVSPLGDTIAGAAMLVAYANETYRTGRTNADGECCLDLYRTDQELKVLAAAEGYLPLCTTVVPEGYSTVALELELSTEGRKAILFPMRTGFIPGIEGRLSPINDGRAYVYADNIAINGRPANPASFEIGESLHLIDVYGVETTIQFLMVTSQFSLIEYTEPKPYGAER